MAESTILFFVASTKYMKRGVEMLTALKLSDLKFTRKEMKIQNLPLDKIRPNPYQPRRYFDNRALEELAESIKQFGVMQPITVRLINGCSYELVAGERRLRACKIAGLSTIPTIVVNLNDNDSALLALIENIQRQNLNYIEEAEGYQNLMQDYELTQEELAIKLGKSQSTIANKLRVLKLSSEIKNLLITNELTERHARALLKIPDDEIQKDILFKIINQELNVKKTEELVEDILVKMRANELPKVEKRVKRRVNDIRIFTNTIRQSVDIIRKNGVDATYDVNEKENFYEIKIQIPM